MRRLWLIEWKKASSYRAFWILLGLYIFMATVAVRGAFKMSGWIEKAQAQTEGYSYEKTLLGPLDLWSGVAYIVGILKVVLGLVVITGIANEFTYGTARQQIADGMSRGEYITAKILANAGLSILSLGTVICLALYVHRAIQGPKDDLWAGVDVLFPYFLEVFTLLSLALWLGLWVQRTASAFMLLIVLPVIEWVAVSLIGGADAVRPYLPMKAIGNLVAAPFFPLKSFPVDATPTPVSATVMATGWAILFNVFAYLHFKKADI